MWTAAQICTAIEHERAIAREPIRALIKSASPRLGGVQLDLEPLRDLHNRPIDESLEGARAWWGGAPAGTADVFAVDPDRPSIFLSRLSGPMPASETIISIYEPDYLKALAELWASPALAGRASQTLVPTSSAIEVPTCTLNHFYLREGQRRALGLPRIPLSLLWGPPGTGKTTTLGALVAEEIASGRSRRVLVTATTHTAVDQCVLAIDKALQGAGAESTRKSVKRFGSRADPKFFVGREHLLPVHNQEAFEALSILLEREPPKSELEAWSAWKRETDALRARLKVAMAELLARNLCVGMTSTSAFFWFPVVMAAGVDLVVVDEASQVSGPAARMLAIAGGRILFAGDPKQLSAVVRTKDLGSRKVLSQTAFEIASEAPQVFLNEQSRMARQICSVVSETFYGGKLIVARKELNDKKWLQYRSANFISGIEQPAVQVRTIKGPCEWSRKYNGPIRYESAQAILELIDDMLGAYIEAKDLIVLSPFRAHRTMLRRMLAARRTRNVLVSTVHKAQGSERKIVMFDPVDGTSPFLSGADGDRLINVAISRAQAQVVIFASDHDLANPTLRKIATVATSGDKRKSASSSARAFQPRAGS